MLNIQADLRRRLEEALQDIPVYVNIPEKRPQAFVVVQREGGSADNYSIIDRAGIGINCYAISESEACALCEKVVNAINALPFTGGYAKIEQEACYSDYDVSAKSPRWYLSYTFSTYKPIKGE